MKIFLILLFFVGISSSFSCKKNSTNSAPTHIDTLPVDTIHHIDTIPVTNTFFAKGADVSWVTQMESQGLQFYNRSGMQQDIFQVLKSEGINSMRLRAWVNPADGYNNTADVVAKAIRAKNAGMKIMIDFHYSDTWADPGHQTMPVAWANEDINDLQLSVHDYTVSVMDSLKTNGIFPDWVQVGNETNDGMLWPLGQASINMANFALLVNAGYNGVKSVSDSSKVIIHISNGYDNSLFRWMFDGLKNNGAKWDIIGMSLYPSASNWNDLNTQCFANMNDMVTRYNKPVMICEVGMSWTDSVACKSFISNLISKTKSVANGKGLGVFYWEPEAFNSWQGYSLGAFDNSGKPTIALDAFK
jgi:arabinogalactan endo-1,4-beta-galactosidase